MELIKLYKKHAEKLYYAESWTNEHIATIHTGVVGDKGESKEILDIKDHDSFFADFQNEWLAKGYTPFPKEQQFWLVLQYPMKTITGSVYNRSIRDRATKLLNEHLGWFGLGYVDGFDMGKTSNPQEEFALNIFCVVVDAEIAVKSIIEMLPLQLDCSRLKIAVRPFSNDAPFVLRYSARKNENTFYI